MLRTNIVLLALLAAFALSAPAGARMVSDPRAPMSPALTPTLAALESDTPSPSTTAPAPVPPAKAELLVDVDTGRVLFGEHEHQLLPPASLTKMLTAMIAVNWLPPGTVIPVNATAANASPDKVGMKAGQRWPLDIVLHALLISSANDAAYALAERVGGSLQGFEPIMATAAAQLGMADGEVFHDPAGLDGTEGLDGGNLVSAWDVAVAARDLLSNPTLASIAAMKTFTFTGPDKIVYELSNHNLAFLNSYPGAIGIKTGFTDPAGSCLAAAATRSGRTMVAVIMNGDGPDATATALLNQGFATPVSTEADDPTLPAVRQPAPPWPIRDIMPPPRLPLGLLPSTTDPPSPAPTVPPAASLQAAAAPTALAGSRHPAGVLQSPRDVGGLAAAVLAAVAMLVGRQVRNRRRLPVGAHSPRRPG